MGKIIPFPTKPNPPVINWGEIEKERKISFSKVPEESLEIIKMIFETRTKIPKAKRRDWYLIIHDTEGEYPSDRIDITRRRSDVIWILDLLDRFGGELNYGKHTCEIIREHKRPPIFLIQQISEGTKDSLCKAVQSFDCLLESDRWQLLGKELPGTTLTVVLIESKDSSQTAFLGLFDRRTANILFNRLEEGMPVEELIGYAKPAGRGQFDVVKRVVERTYKYVPEEAELYPSLKDFHEHWLNIIFRDQELSPAPIDELAEVLRDGGFPHDLIQEVIDLEEEIVLSLDGEPKRIRGRELYLIVMSSIDSVTESGLDNHED